jgi:hypothetical protein
LQAVYYLFKWPVLIHDTALSFSIEISKSHTTQPVNGLLRLLPFNIKSKSKKYISIQKHNSLKQFENFKRQSLLWCAAN